MIECKNLSSKLIATVFLHFNLLKLTRVIISAHILHLNSIMQYAKEKIVIFFRVRCLENTP